jgi:hypothetical protein
MTTVAVQLVDGGPVAEEVHWLVSCVRKVSHVVLLQVAPRVLAGHLVHLHFEVDFPLDFITVVFIGSVVIRIVIDVIIATAL